MTTSAIDYIYDNKDKKLLKTQIPKVHSFPRAAEFRAELRNLPFSTEFWYFSGIWQKLRNDQRLVRSSAWWRNFITECKLYIYVTEKIKLNWKQKIWANAHQTREKLSPFRRSSFLEYALQPKIAKINKTHLFWNFRVFKSHQCSVDKTEKLVTRACFNCDMQDAHAYLQPFSRKTSQKR